MRPKTLTMQLDTADADGIAQSQTPSGAGNLTLNGALVSGGVATLDAPRRILVTTVSNESAKTLTFTGTDRRGYALTETMTGPNATTGYTNADFATVTQVAVSAAFTGAVTVGTNGIGSSQVYVPDRYKNPINIGLGIDVTGTVDCTVQHTFDDVFASTFTPAGATWHSHDALAAQTADVDGNYAFSPTGIRLLINSGIGTAALTIVQAG